MLLWVTAGAARADKPVLPTMQRDINVVAFWSTTCAPCKDELPLVEALYQKYKADPKVRVLVVNIDPARESATARKMAAGLKLTVPVVTGGEAIYERLFGDDLSIPRLAVFDRQNAGVERNGVIAGEKPDAFVRDVAAAIESVRAGAPRTPTMQWAALKH
jgi:thiol-disulfide isomerase/thioredoxin